MNYKIKILGIVEDDVKRIFDYILLKSSDLSISKNIADQIYGSIYSLNFLPYRYQTIFENTRSLNVKSYKIFYEICEKNKIVIIYRVLGGSQNYKTSFKNSD